MSVNQDHPPGGVGQFGERQSVLKGKPCTKAKWSTIAGNGLLPGKQQLLDHLARQVAQSSPYPETSDAVSVLLSNFSEGFLG